MFICFFFQQPYFLESHLPFGAFFLVGNSHIIGALEHITGTLLDRRDRSSSSEGSGGPYGVHGLAGGNGVPQM